MPFMSPIKKAVKNSYNKLNKKLSRTAKPIAFAFSFVLVSVCTLLVARAAPLTADREAENATLAGNVSRQADAGASGGSYIHFGMGHSEDECAPGPVITLGTCLNPATVPAAVVGADGPRTRRETEYGPRYLDGVGALRTECLLSHTSKNDPIVYPGEKDAAHWHIFFGNTAADENMTDPMTEGNSTCEGGTLNRTAYWAPALIDTSSYNPTTRMFDMVPVMSLDQRSPTGIVQGFWGGNPLQVYYKSGYDGPQSADIEPFPPGLRMIAGADPNNVTGPPNRHVRFDCLIWGDATSAYNGISDRDSIPTDCPPGYFIQAKVMFPQCGARNQDGTPVLDSENHRSHMAYGLGWPPKTPGCPPEHPIPYAEIIEHFRWQVHANGAAGLRFSSDMYDMSLPGGWSFHADWWMGWDEPTFQAIVDNCYHGTIGGSLVGLDCQMNLFAPHPSGGWRALTGI